MTDTDPVALIEAKVTAAIAADEDGDVARALQLMEQAQMLLAVTPDGKIEEEAVNWDRESINHVVSNLRRRSAASAGIVTHEVKYVRE